MHRKSERNFWVYIILCENSHYYTGYTTDINARYQTHVAGTGGCKYTRAFKPVKLAQCWLVKESKSLAMQLEHAIKRRNRAQKEKLISQPASLSTDDRVQTVSAKQLATLVSQSTAQDEHQQ